MTEIVQDETYRCILKAASEAARSSHCAPSEIASSRATPRTERLVGIACAIPTGQGSATMLDNDTSRCVSRERQLQSSRERYGAFHSDRLYGAPDAPRR